MDTHKDTKELYEQKRQAQLDEWRAELAVLKARASQRSVDEQLSYSRDIEVLESKVEHGESHLADLRKTDNDTWEAIKEGFESMWESIGDAFSSTMGQPRK